MWKNRRSHLPRRQDRRRPRKHHFVPKCWLAGFTETLEPDGTLWVTDFVRQKQWSSSPGKTARITDFYRLSDQSRDPVYVENALSKIEAEAAPILQVLARNPRSPNPDELEMLLQFMAVQWVRVPSFRPFVLDVLRSITTRDMAAALETCETWQATLRESGTPEDTPGADYDGMKEFFESGQYTLSAENDWYVERGFTMAEKIIPLLRARYWETEFSPAGRYVATDNPVVMDGAEGEMVGFKNADVKLYPVNRFVLLRGTPAKMGPVPVSLGHISATNTMMILRAHQVYSYRRISTGWMKISSIRRTGIPFRKRSFTI